MAPPLSSARITNSPSLPPHRSHHFTPIHEGNESEEEGSERHRQHLSATPTPTHHQHHPTPLHPSTTPSPSPSSHTKASSIGGKRSTKKRPPDNAVAVSCNNCRPSSRDKTASLVVPVLDGGVNKHHSASAVISIPSPNGILKSILSGLSRRSPKHHHHQPPSETSSSSTTSSAAVGKEDRWKAAATELSQKLVQANRKRDEAILEASKLKYSMAELEKKLNKLEIYCHSLKSGLDVCSSSSSFTRGGGGGVNSNDSDTNNNNHRFSPFVHLRIDGGNDQIIDNFLVSVSESRSAVRLFSRALTVQIRQMGAKVMDRISTLLQPYDLKISSSVSKNPRTLVFYLEALLNLALFEDFESAGFARGSTNRILNPIDRCEAQYAAFGSLQSLTWEEVLSKGTKHFSEDFSRFCDRKMSEIVGLLGWTRAWPEPLLQAFFGASKSVWLVHLLANSVHPSLPVFRVEKGSAFDGVYMEDMGGERAARRLVPSEVRIMVSPGFYVYDNVVKCKVLCRYTCSTSTGVGVGVDGSVIVCGHADYEKGLTP